MLRVGKIREKSEETFVRENLRISGILLVYLGVHGEGGLVLVRVISLPRFGVSQARRQAYLHTVHT